MSSIPATGAPIFEAADPPSPPKSNSSDSFHNDKNETIIEALYSPSEEASQLPPGSGGSGDDAIVDEPSVFDDPALRKFYWPRKNYENIHRFFPDFKWTVAEEKR
jgi:hypothetical protein